MLKRIIASTVMATATHTMRPSRSQRPRKEEVAGGEACALISPTPRPSSLVPSVTTPLYSTTVSQALRQTLRVGVLRELLRRLMSNCGKRGRSRNSMLALNLRPKVVPHGPRLLLGLIVRISGRLVAGRPRSGPEPPGSSGLAHGPGGHHPGDPGPVAALQKREGLLALRLGAPARVLPEALLPGPVQPQGTSPGARVARLAAVPRRGTLRSFGRLPRDGHDPRPGHRAGEGFPQGALLRAGHLRQERLQDLVVGLGLQGGPGGRSWGSHHRLRAGRGLFRGEAHSRDALVAGDRHEAYLADKGFTGVEWERRWLEKYGALVAATPYEDSRRAWPKADRRWAAGKRQIVEGVIHQLKDFFSLESHRAKTLGGLLARLAAKVAAYTCAQRINDSLGRPKRQLADLLL